MSKAPTKPVSMLETIMEVLLEHTGLINAHADIINKQRDTVVSLHAMFAGLQTTMGLAAEALKDLDARLTKLEKKK